MFSEDAEDLRTFFGIDLGHRRILTQNIPLFEGLYPFTGLNRVRIYQVYMDETG